MNTVQKIHEGPNSLQYWNSLDLFDWNQFFAGFHLWFNIRVNILTVLSPQEAKLKLGENLLAGIWAEC